MNSIIARLWQSTVNLHSRFFPVNPPSFQARYDVFVEESNEFKTAVSEEYEFFPASERPLVSSHNAVHELADTIVTGMGLLQCLGYAPDDLERAIEDVIRKNDAKTLDTHHVNEWGKIARKVASISEPR